MVHSSCWSTMSGTMRRFIGFLLWVYLCLFRLPTRIPYFLLPVFVRVFIDYSVNLSRRKPGTRITRTDSRHWPLDPGFRRDDGRADDERRYAAASKAARTSAGSTASTTRTSPRRG